MIERVTGDGTAETLIAPLWSKKKLVVQNEIDKGESQLAALDLMKKQITESLKVNREELKELKKERDKMKDNKYSMSEEELRYLKYDKEQKKELISCFAISMEIPINGIFHRNSILAYFDDPRYRRSNSGIIQYEIESIIKKDDLIEDQGIKEFPTFKIKCCITKFYNTLSCSNVFH